MWEENVLCSATMPKSLLSFGNRSCVYLRRLQDDPRCSAGSTGSGSGEGAWLWLSEHPASAVKTAATHCPQGKAEQMVLPSLPPATLKERHIFCFTCVAQGQNLQRWLPTKMSLGQALERSTEDSEVSFKAKFFKLFFSETIGAILLKLGVSR